MNSTTIRTGNIPSTIADAISKIVKWTFVNGYHLLMEDYNTERSWMEWTS
nr:MAG TPA: hypothetical protein [Caudoviricetes sp.]DAO77611.1 MAG TPA: hypothetical protein [Caudoviricetes sp.]